MNTPIKSFDGEYRFLSNFYPCKIYWNNGLIEASSAEHLYQALKTTDKEMQEIILAAESPAKAKKLGKVISDSWSNEEKNEWHKTSHLIMEHVVEAKFKEPTLKWKLLWTFPQPLIEGNYWHDNFWGECYCDKCTTEIKYNHLGKILMSLRGDLYDREIPLGDLNDYFLG